jgi:hypothetical protein
MPRTFSRPVLPSAFCLLTSAFARSSFILPPSSFILAVLLCIAASAFAGFTQITEGDIVNDGGWSYACGWADINSDGFPDLVVMNNNGNQGKHNFLYLNNGDGTFTRVAEGPVVADSGSSYGCSWADIDNDGDADLFVSNYNENNCLYLNNGDGAFTKVTAGRIVTDGGKSTGCAWADYDRDGLLDLFVCNRDEVNFLYHNDGGGSFTRILTGAIATDVDNSSGCAWGDYDNDGWPDLFVANVQTPNCLYHNEGDGTFTKVTSGAIVSDTSLCNGASWADYDNDGDLDLVVPTGVLGTYNDLLYRNEGADSFTRVTGTPITANPTWSGGSGWGDFDNDADLDLFIGGYDGHNRLYEGDGAGNFTSIDTGAVVLSDNYIMAATWCDYDNDGQLDLYTARNNYFGGNSHLYHNDGGWNHWLTVRLVGTVSNRPAIGARVYASARVNSQPVRQLREITSQSGGCNSGQSPLDAAFGLGDATFVDTLAVWWPSGRADTLFDVPADRFITITEGQTALAESPARAPIVSDDLRMTIAPNPCDAQAAINLTLTAGGAARLEIIDAAGRVVRSWSGILTPTFVLRTSDLPSAVYLLRVTAGGRACAARLGVLP